MLGSHAKALYTQWYVQGLKKIPVWTFTKEWPADPNCITNDCCRLSVCQTRGLWQNERNLCPHSYTTRKIIHPSLLTTSTWNLGQTDPVGAKRRFSIDIRSYHFSRIMRSKKSTINTNRKFTTPFPMSLRWTSYVALSPQRGLITKRTFSV